MIVIFPVIIVLAILILVRVLMPDLSKLKYSKDFQTQIETFNLKEGDELDLILPKNRFEVQVYVRGNKDQAGKLAVSRNEKLYKKAEKGIIKAKLISTEDDNLRIEFFEKVSQA
ncbi:hypothetical protein [Flavobacterium sp. AG291]|uniref:hypothetical protein n=1 Tax=Flavobacterium sp. AG291 TaxID=2184000 RepID=UPI000E0C3CCC|nr:hypothetical protein [Flavobacterium sp. AG291]RDI07073.1 hypothetical protein DEU42_113173 [Flavobacterium sp. AG291]